MFGRIKTFHIRVYSNIIETMAWRNLGYGIKWEMSDYEKTN
jgi:hypothetical protein